MKIFIYFFTLFLLISTVFASSMAVSPPKTTVLYTGQEHYESQITINPKGEKTIRVFASGDLAPYITLNGQQELTLFMQGSETIPFRISLPVGIKPGDYQSYIVAEQVGNPDGPQAIAVAVAAIGHVITVRVPNEGRYLEGTLVVENNPAKEGEDVIFMIDLLNIGTETLTDLQTDFVILSSDQEIARIPSNTVSTLESTQSASLKGSWPTTDISAGLYEMKADLAYGGLTDLHVEQDVRVGGISIDILNVESFLDGNIGRFFVEIESNWNDEIANVHAELVIRNATEEITRLKTSSVDIPPWGVETLEAFWEREEISAGRYDVEIYVYYFDKIAQKQIQVHVPLIEQPSSFNTTMLLLIIIILILLLVNFIWFGYALSQNKKKKRKKK